MTVVIVLSFVCKQCVIVEMLGNVIFSYHFDMIFLFVDVFLSTHLFE
jgi:hypothetical protein